MMKTTENFELKKPDADDFYNVEDQNDNMDIIDQELGNRISCAISSTEPPQHNVLWFLPVDGDNSVTELLLGTNEADADVQAYIEGTAYSVQNLKNTESSKDLYSYEII